jgi:hypothetical protein
MPIRSIPSLATNQINELGGPRYLLVWDIHTAESPRSTLPGARCEDSGCKGARIAEDHRR